MSSRSRSSLPTSVQRHIEKARNGKYLRDHSRGCQPGTPEPLFFQGRRADIRSARRCASMCVFSRHDLIEDPPFSKLDLISCRNVLILPWKRYERMIIALFHYALKQNGFLMLGLSEKADSEGLFSIIDRDHRIYAKREIATRPHRFSLAGTCIVEALASARWSPGRGFLDSRTAQTWERRSIVSSCRDTARLPFWLMKDWRCSKSGALQLRFSACRWAR